MLTSKQRSFLRGLANPIRPTLQLGKEGLTDEFIRQFDEMIEPRELVKINVLESNGLDAKETAQDLAAKSGAEVVQVIGHKITLYRASSLDPKIDLKNLCIRDTKTQETAKTGKKKRPIAFPKLGRTTGPNSRAMRLTGLKAQNANSASYGRGPARMDEAPRNGDVPRGTSEVNYTSKNAGPRSSSASKGAGASKGPQRSNTQKSRSK